MVSCFWACAGVKAASASPIAPALETLAALEVEGMADRFDFAFIDAHKPEYDGYYEACLRLVRPGGLIAFDNMLQGGDVADKGERGPGVTAIRALNAKIAKDGASTRCSFPSAMA